MKEREKKTKQNIKMNPEKKEYRETRKTASCKETIMNNSENYNNIAQIKNIIM